MGTYVYKLVNKPRLFSTVNGAARAAIYRAPFHCKESWGRKRNTGDGPAIAPKYVVLGDYANGVSVYTGWKAYQSEVVENEGLIPIGKIRAKGNGFVFEPWAVYDARYDLALHGHGDIDRLHPLMGDEWLFTSVMDKDFVPRTVFAVRNDADLVPVRMVFPDGDVVRV